jgi:hypothetical protein
MGESEGGTRSGAAARPHHSTVIAWLALFIALGGVASGLPGSNGVGPADIRDGAVRSSEVKDATIKEPDLADAAVTPFKIGPTPAARVDTPAQAPGCAAQVIEDAGSEIVQFSIEAFDTQDLHAGPPADCVAASQSRLTAPIDGIYTVHAQVMWPNDVGARAATLLKTDTGGSVAIARETAAGASNAAVQAIGTTIDLVAGEYVELRVTQQGAGGDLALSSQLDNYMSMAWIGPAP